MSSHSSDFAKEHPVATIVLALIAGGLTLAVRSHQSSEAFNKAVAQCERGITPQHQRPRQYFSRKAQRREDSRVALVNRAIDRALKSDQCRGPRW